MKLKKWRHENGLTLEQLSEMTGRSVATLSRVERDLNYPDSDTLRAIMAATGGAVTPNDFFGVAPSEDEAA